MSNFYGTREIFCKYIVIFAKKPKQSIFSNAAQQVRKCREATNYLILSHNYQIMNIYSQSVNCTETISEKIDQFVSQLPLNLNTIWYHQQSVLLTIRFSSK